MEFEQETSSILSNFENLEQFLISRRWKVTNNFSKILRLFSKFRFYNLDSNVFSQKLTYFIEYPRAEYCLKQVVDDQRPPEAEGFAVLHKAGR